MNNLLDVIVKTIDEKKANDIVTVDFKRENPLCDYFVIADAPSVRQINAIAEFVEVAIEKEGYKIRSIERQHGSTWILIDAYDVVVHLFLTEERGHYNLEKLYQGYIDENVLR
ncbi:ribosome silencing factor [Erysipelothrix rhusiopathiae]|nr:ribosome silencing factor [Erysipelothrix rhusiopathiae]MDE8035972.1 ribosome silencing factor [Erysipelothrix rhusiopathiae]MDE8043415.1 ribosome silencing factor [Erysipelothrix rhusiopathiae]MDE8054674.1 ribosome silencing factor [Erysipelothrix rhusiopathiae]MDE8056363.1 ribosome silencing factor [Erysipelothrix rhusiopathiae]